MEAEPLLDAVHPGLNLYFGTNLSPLPDRTFADENDRHPYTWFEVTSTAATE